MNELLEVAVHALSHEGRGIATVDGKTVFIAGALPGERVTFRYQKHKGRYAEGILVDILEASKDRVVPPCPHFDLCGGCSLQHLEVNAALRFKETAVLENLKHIGQVVPERVLEPMVGERFGYRRRARIGVKFVIKKNKLILGFHEKNHRYIADLDGCEILHPVVAKEWQAIREMLSTLAAYRDIPQIEVAVGDNMAALVFRHLSVLSEKDKATLSAFGLQHRLAIYLQPKGIDSVEPLWLPAGETGLRYHLSEANIDIHFQATDFIQINSVVNQTMVKRVIELLEIDNHDTVLDLFCGLGNFTLPVARVAKKVVGVEGSEIMVTRALNNAAINGLNNVDFYASDLQKLSFDEAWAAQSYDKIILDPPRTGAKELIPSIAKWLPKRLVYISCQSATFARDIGELVHQHGFTLAATGALDMFPHTTHIESIALLTR